MQYANDASYEGEWVKNRFHGVGCYVWPSNSRYQGAWHQGQRHGFGVQTEPSGEKYEGQWRLGEKHGHGTQRQRNGRCRDGIWKRDTFITWMGGEYFGANVLNARGLVGAADPAGTK